MRRLSIGCEVATPPRSPARGWRAGGVLLWAWLALVTRLHGASLQASLDRDTITLGESATVTLIFHQGRPEAAPRLPALPNATWAGGRTSEETSIANGAASFKFNLSYDLTPTQPGDLLIPGIPVRVGGQILSTQPLRLKVLKPEDALAGAGGAPPAAFLRLIPAKTQVYLAEPFTFEVQFYRQEGEPLQFAAIPADGLTVLSGKQIQRSQARTMLANRPYVVDTFRFGACPNRTGLLTLGPVTLVAQVPDPNARRGRDPFFGSLFGPPPRQVNLVAPVTNIIALPLPTQNVPPAFSGAVGVFSLTVTAGPTNVVVGDPITVKVQIAGRGQLEGLALPPQPEWRDFKSYPPESKFEPGDTLGLTGVKSFELVVAPQNSEIKGLPAFTFSFFDPEQRAYRTLTGPAFPLLVRPAGLTAAVPTLPGTTNAAAARPQVTDIEPIKVHLGAAVAERPALVRQGWFLGLQGLPPALWLAMLGWRKRHEALANNPRLRRQRQVAQLVRQGLAELRTHAQSKQAEAFFALLFRLLQEQIGERLDAPASSITESVVQERLEPRGLPEAARAALHDLFKVCNLARYAPIKSSQELAALIPKVEAALTALQQLPDHGAKGTHSGAP